jgi:hypothetical protein
MPNPKDYDSEDKWMSACVPRMVDEGKKQEQAVAACLSMWKNKERGEGQGVGGERQGDGGADKCVCPECGATAEHEKGTPCSEMSCPECGAKMEGEQDKAISLWNYVKGLFKEKPMKTVGGEKYPASDFLVVEDPQSPSTWHLQVKKHGKPDHGLMGAAKAALTSAGGHRGNRYQGPNRQAAISKLKKLYESENMEWTKEVSHPFTIWKDTETGQYRWLAIYSNKWRDDDNPPEILASSAHKDFEEAVDKGDWPYPETWLWHIPGTRFGVADFVTYDDSGFALASGTVDKGKEDIAEALAQEDDLATSHGMPVKEIERDKEDSTIITRYRSVEISPLPREAAANKYGTGFEILQEVKMAIPEHKRPSVEKWLGADRMKALEDFLSDKAKELDELDIQSKDTDAHEDVEEEAQAVAQEVEEEGVEEEPEAKEEAPTEETPQYVTASDVAEAVGAYLKPIMDKLESLTAIEAAVEEQGKEIKALKKSTEEQVKETMRMTPAASLFDQIASVVGSDDTYIDGRSTLAKAGPKENHDANSDGPSKVGIINELFAQAWDKRQ